MYSLFNVVWYDGCDAFVSKFILPTKDNEVTKDGERDVIRYLDGNGELLKIDYLYNLSLENIIAMRRSEDKEHIAAYDRFANMYFN